MALSAGALSQVSVANTTASLLSAAATGGTGPYTYQWYRSTSTGFSPGAGNIISGATSLALNDSNLIPGTNYFYKVIATDTGNANATVTSSQLAVSTLPGAAPSPNQLAQSVVVGQTDLKFNMNTLPVQIDMSQSGLVYAGQAVKIVDSAGGVPKVVACSANSDACIGFINFDYKSASFQAGDACNISMSGNVIYLYATGAISRFAQVQLDVSSPAAVAAKTGSSGASIVGYAMDKATAAGQLIRVMLQSPSFAVA